MVDFGGGVTQWTFSSPLTVTQAAGQDFEIDGNPVTLTVQDTPTVLVSEDSPEPCVGFDWTYAGTIPGVVSPQSGVVG